MNARKVSIKMFEITLSNWYRFNEQKLVSHNTLNPILNLLIQLLQLLNVLV